ASFAVQVVGRQVEDTPELVPIPRDGRPLPLSFAQQRLWFLHQLQPDAAWYTVPVVLRLRGPLNHAALEQSLSALVARHEILRTSFAYDPLHTGPEPYQQIAPPRPVPLPVMLLPASDEATIRQVIQALVERPFDLQNGPLLRATLVQLAPEDQILALVLHHAIFDGWSLEVLLHEVITCYQAFAQGAAIELPPLPVQYADYAVWQRQWLQGEVLDQQLGYWRQHLANLAPLDLPTDYRRAATVSEQSASVAFQISAALTDAVSRLSQELGATLFMTLLAALKVLLARWSGQTDLAVGTPIAGRVRPELDELIGFFVNTLVLRTDLAGHPSFADLVARVRQTALHAYTHQDVPFEMVVEELQPERDLSRHPLTQVMFVLHNTPRLSMTLPDLTVEPLGVEPLATEFDLTLTVSESRGGLRGEFTYRRDLFAPDTMARMVGHLETLLAAVVDDPHQPIDQLPLLTETEYRQVLAQGVHLRSLVMEQSVHALIAAQAARRPDAIAVVGENRSLSYAELDRRANQLANYLRERGVGLETRVALCLERTPDLIMALLGVLKAGGAYVPLDPGYPQEHIQFILQDAAIALVLTQADLRERLPESDLPAICLDTAWPTIAQLPTTAPDVRVDPANLAYVIYTSGSLGTPKGVLIAHSSLVNYTEAAHALYGITPADRVLQFASITFDASAEEIYPCLTCGATLVLRTDEMLETPTTFLRTCGAWQISVLSLPTAYWHQVAAYLDPGVALPATLRLLIIGGERALPDRLAQWRERAGDVVTVVNTYGPTEATVVVTGAIIAGPNHVALASRELPIGRPLCNIQAYILDSRLQPQPIGVPGELHIGGASLARGYLNRPDLTATSFIPDPFSPTPGAQLYKTGDLARFRGDGEIEFVGRVDQQVKVRGFRIEPGEIEAVLRTHEAVRDAVVVVRDERLVAYVVEHRNTGTQEHGDRRDLLSLAARGMPQPDDTRPGKGTAQASGERLASDLRVVLQSRLPSYMVPAAIVVLDALPLSSSNKIDRRALPAPDATAFAPTVAAVAPRDPWEVWLAELWAGVLGHDGVGVTDNFFALGGHSLLAVRLMTEIQQCLGRAIPLATLLQAPTIAQLAEYLRNTTPGLPWSPLVPLQPDGSQRPLFLIHPIGGTVLCYGELARLLGPDQPVYGLQARGVEPDQTPHESLAAMVEEYLAAIRQTQPHGPYRLGGWSFGGVVAFAIASQLQQQGETIDLVALIDSSGPIAEAAPLDDLTLLTAFLRDLGGLLGTSLPITATELAPLPADERMAVVLERAHMEGVLPPDLDLRQLQRLAHVFAANLTLLAAYRPARTAPPVALLLAEATAQRSDLMAEWRALTAVMTCGVVSGTHYTLLRSPQVQAVADWLRAQLAASPIIA
ncbi:MAG TPA: amino acid adenylation domain-containing protein, partial [Herpetosiphonaceae bacterium]